MRRIFTAAIMATLLVSCVGTKKEAMPWEGKIKEDEQQEQEGEQGLPAGYVTGKKLPAWSEGVFDIHAINSARGECSFIIMPDGTTMVIDAGEVESSSSYNSVPARPNATIKPYKVYADYIKAFRPAGATAIDYFNLSHYHSDHAGVDATKGYSLDPAGGYPLLGMYGLYSEIPYNTLIDRDYPRIDQTTVAGEVDGSNMNMGVYQSFVNYLVSNNKLKVEKARVGAVDQVVLKKNATKYSNFKVQCVGGNGYAWNGSASVDFRNKAENARSVCWLFSYGKFDYFTSGDMNNTNECKAVVNGIGRKVEAMKCHHHMSNPDSFNADNAVLEPKVIVTQSFYVRPNQPHQTIISECKPNQNMFFTNIDFTLAAKEGATVGGTKNIPLDQSKYTKVKDRNGHVVIRFFPGKEQFYVFMLDDTDQLYKIKAIYGPYSCY